MQIILRDLPKISLNKWYASEHWSKRKRLKDNYKLIVKSQFKDVFKKDKQYEVEYSFFFKSRPLDASNCIAMVKMIEDIIFEDDKWDIVLNLKISSHRSKSDYVWIDVDEIQKHDKSQ
jgi:hypothetical protein